MTTEVASSLVVTVTGMLSAHVPSRGIATMVTADFPISEYPYARPAAQSVNLYVSDVAG
jgi:hypothetical protein